MSHRPRWLSTLSLVVVGTLLVAACGTPGATQAPTTRPSSGPATTSAPPASAPPASGTPAASTPAASASESAAPSESASASAPTGDLMTYPDGSKGEVDCAAGTYNGNALTGGLKQIKAVDASTVEFTFCRADVAFLSKVAFSSLQINDTETLTATGGGGDELTRKSNGTGPYKLTEFSDQQVVMEANPDYWGDQPKSPKLVIRWNKEPAQRLQALQSGTEADGIDNVAPDAFETVRNDANLQLIEREALNVTYLGFNNKFKPFDDPKVRQAVAMALDKQRIVDAFYGSGSSIGDYFTPCSIPGGCEGDKMPGFDAAAAQALLAGTGAEAGFETTLYFREKPRSYINNPTAVVTDIKDQLETNLGWKVTLSPEEDASYLTNASKGEKYPLFLLGWGADYPDQTNFLDYHFGSGASPQFGDKFKDLTDVLDEAASKADPAARLALYAQANTLLKTNLPMVPLAHGGSATAWRKDVQGAHSSPLSSEALFTVTPGDRSQLVWIQNGPPSGLYCGDETDGEALRVCEQLGESLYGYEVGGTATQPSLATSCEPNTELTVWTCKLREGVKFHNGATLDANDVVLSFAAQWDLDHPLHKGRTGAGTFDYFSAFFGFLNVKPEPAPEPSPSAPGESPSAPAESPSAPAESPSAPAESPSAPASESPSAPASESPSASPT
ncbi:MAG: peptide ABC transporter substrate-binding protein [Chloroflexi bacterium]|nr:peptide ABC transporter substrate-binding protein [Chloroflexota bacterium]